MGKGGGFAETVRFDVRGRRTEAPADSETLNKYDLRFKNVRDSPWGAGSVLPSIPSVAIRQNGHSIVGQCGNTAVRQ